MQRKIKQRSHRIRLIAFDLGGVVVPDATSAIHRQVADFLSVPQSDYERAVSVFHERVTTGDSTLLEFYTAILCEGGITAVTPRQALDEHLDAYRARVLDNGYIPATIRGVIEELKSRYTVVCLTNTEPEVADLNRRKGLYGLFHRAYLSTEMGMMKPSVGIYRRVLSDFDARGDELLFIDDNKENLRSSRELGIISILYKDPEQLRTDLASVLGVQEQRKANEP